QILVLIQQFLFLLQRVLPLDQLPPLLPLLVLRILVLLLPQLLALITARTTFSHEIADYLNKDADKSHHEHQCQHEHNQEPELLVLGIWLVWISQAKSHSMECHDAHFPDDREGCCDPALE